MKGGLFRVSKIKQKVARVITVQMVFRNIYACLTKSQGKIDSAMAIFSVLPTSTNLSPL